jgi:hypothetical protein
MERRAAIDRGWPVIENKARATLTGSDAALESFFFLPPGKDFLLQLREIYPTADRSKHKPPPYEIMILLLLSINLTESSIEIASSLRSSQ